MAFMKKKKMMSKEVDDDKDEEVEGIGKSAEAREYDKAGDEKGKIAKGSGKGKKMNPAKHKVMMKLSKRLASSKGKVY